MFPGDTYSFTFEEAGDYEYHCIPHPYMRGRVVVVTF
jgi:plastocyanin